MTHVIFGAHLPRVKSKGFVRSSLPRVARAVPRSVAGSGPATLRVRPSAAAA